MKNTQIKPCDSTGLPQPTSYFQRASLRFVEDAIKDAYGVDSNETLEYATGGVHAGYLELLWYAQDWYADTYREEGCDSLKRMKEIIIECVEDTYPSIVPVHGYEPVPERYMPERDYPF
jgi:hypothetical protein